MRRGRWVAYCFAFFLCIIIARPVFATSLGMTAEVPLSPLWKQALRANSTGEINLSHAHMALVTERSLGIQSLPVEKQIIQLLVFKNGFLVDNQVQITNKAGVADFVFVSETSQTYSIVVVNKTDELPFVVRNATISL